MSAYDPPLRRQASPAPLAASQASSHSAALPLRSKTASYGAEAPRQLAIDPALHRALDVREIGHHVAAVERLGLNLELDDRVMAVRMLADAVVVEQPMAVTEVQALGDRIHAQ